MPTWNAQDQVEYCMGDYQRVRSDEVLGVQLYALHVFHGSRSVGLSYPGCRHDTMCRCRHAM
jgi:hypothetical protein